jgi:hypothetical protein
VKYLTNKNILLFIPKGKGIYGTGIYHELERRGARVFVYDERPSASVALKIILRIAKQIIEPYILYYFKRIISQNKGISFDYILIVRGEGFTAKVMQKLRCAYPGAIYILYLWDSIKYNNTKSLFPYFDRILSFDPEDVKKYAELTLRPLFFLPQYQTIAQKMPSSIDVLFIGTVHSDRYSFIVSLESFIKSNGLITFFYLFFPSKLIFWQKKLTDPIFRKCHPGNFKYEMMTADEASGYMEKARASLDVEGPGQTGLTMRTIEVLGAKRKLITTNKTIQDYDFYDERNILIVNRDNPIIDLKFIKTPFSEIDPDIYNRYSIEAWIDELFFGSNQSYLKNIQTISFIKT